MPSALRAGQPTRNPTAGSEHPARETPGFGVGEGNGEVFSGSFKTGMSAGAFLSIDGDVFGLGGVESAPTNDVRDNTANPNNDNR